MGSKTVQASYRPHSGKATAHISRRVTLTNHRKDVRAYFASRRRSGHPSFDTALNSVLEKQITFEVPQRAKGRKVL